MIHQVAASISDATFYQTTLVLLLCCSCTVLLRSHAVSCNSAIKKFPENLLLVLQELQHTCIAVALHVCKPHKPLSFSQS